MLSKNHRLYKAFKEMKNKEKEIQKKKEKIFIYPSSASEMKMIFKCRTIWHNLY